MRTIGMSPNTDIASNLKQLIELHGTTESALSRKAGLGHTAARDIILGKSRNPTERTLRKLAHALGEDLSAIINGNPRTEQIGFSESSVEPWRGSDASDLRPSKILDVFGVGLTQPEIFSAKTSIPFLGIMPGDILVVDTGRVAQAGDSVLVTVADLETGAAETLVRRYHPPYVLSGNPSDKRPVLRIDQTGSVVIMGVVTAIIRDEQSRRRTEEGNH